MIAVTAVAKKLLVSNKWIILSVLFTAGSTVEDWGRVSPLTVVITFPDIKQPQLTSSYIAIMCLKFKCVLIRIRQAVIYF